MKKAAILLLVFALCFGMLTGCGSQTPNAPAVDNNTLVSVPETPEEPTPSEEPAPAPSAEPVPSEEPTPSEEPAPAPSEEPAPAPSEEPEPPAEPEPSEEPAPAPSEEPAPTPSEPPAEESTPSKSPAGQRNYGPLSLVDINAGYLTFDRACLSGNIVYIEAGSNVTAETTRAVGEYGYIGPGALVLLTYPILENSGNIRVKDYTYEDFFASDVPVFTGCVDDVANFLKSFDVPMLPVIITGDNEYLILVIE